MEEYFTMNQDCEDNNKLVMTFDLLDMMCGTILKINPNKEVKKTETLLNTDEHNENVDFDHIDDEVSDDEEEPDVKRLRVEGVDQTNSVKMIMACMVNNMDNDDYYDIVDEVVLESEPEVR